MEHTVLKPDNVPETDKEKNKRIKCVKFDINLADNNTWYSPVCIQRAGQLAVHQHCFCSGSTLWMTDCLWSSRWMPPSISFYKGKEILKINSQGMKTNWKIAPLLKHSYNHFNPEYIWIVLYITFSLLNVYVTWLLFYSMLIHGAWQKVETH